MKNRIVIDSNKLPMVVTPRDYFAARAMQSAILTFFRSEYSLPNVESEIARASYEMADAMLKAREQ